MDIQKLAVTSLLLITVQIFGVVHSTLPNPKPPPDAPADHHPERARDEDSGMNLHEKRTFTPPFVNMANFPKHLDLRMLHNMPMVILHPSKPINLEILQNVNSKTQQNAINNLIKILGTLSQAQMDQSKPLIEPNDKDGFRGKDQGNVKNNNKHLSRAPNEETVKDEKQTQDNDAAFSESSSTVVQHNARGFGDQTGWFEKFKGTFSNIFPHRNPFLPRPIPFGSSNSPHLSPGMPPKFPNNLHPNVNPFVASNNNNPVFVPFAGPFGAIHIPQHQLVPLHPGQMINVEFGQEASHQYPLILPVQHPSVPFGGKRRLPFPQPMDQMTSASESLPHRVLPPKRFGGAGFVVPPSPVFTPLSKKHTPITGTSVEISNAFADFAASEQDPEVVEGFANVGGSINKFLNMMGLGVSGITQGFGDFTGLGREMDARSLDFFPGYGNQAMLDDMDDMDVFQEDITEQYLRTLPKTTKPTQKPSTKPPKPSTIVPEKEQSVSKSVPPTKATVPPVFVSKPPSVKQPTQMMHPKTNGSLMGKMAHPKKMEMADAEQSKRPQNGNTGIHHGDVRGMAEKSKMSMPSSMKNQAELKEMMPKQNTPPTPQRELRHTAHVSQNQKNLHTNHRNTHGDAGPNVQVIANHQHRSPNSNYDASKTYQNSHDIRPPNRIHNMKPPVHIDNNQKYIYTWGNNTQQEGNKGAPSIVFGKPMIFYYSNGELKKFDKVINLQTAPLFQAPRPQNHSSEKQKTQRSNNSSGQISKDSEKKPTPPETSDKKSYVSAHSMSDSESSALLNTDDVRPWIPVSTGRGYVERRPVTSHDIKSPRKEQVKEIVEMSFKKQRENSETKREN